MSDLGTELRALVDSAAAPVTLDEVTGGAAGSATVHRRSGGRRGRARRPLLVVAVLAVAAAVAIVAVSTGGDGSGHGPTRAAGRTVGSGWQLTASLSGSQYVLATGNPGAVSQVDCGGGTTCFLSTYYGVGGASSVTGATYVSHDGGHTWSATRLPDGVATATPVSCVSATWCSAGGGLLDPKSGDPLAKKEERDPVLLTTTDAGATWEMHKVPIPPAVEYIPADAQFPAETTYWPGVLDAVDCTSPDVCDVVGHVLDPSSSAVITPDRLVFLRTTDGGVTWSRTVLPERPSESGFEVDGGQQGTGAALSCPSATQCVVLAGLSPVDPDDGVVDAWRTTDGGSTWSETQVQGTREFSPGLSCPDTLVCWGGPTAGALLHSGDGGATWTLVPTPAGTGATGLGTGGAGTGSIPIDVVTWQSVSCTSDTSCVVGGAGMAATSDGGTTWSTVSLPAQVGEVPSVSCELGGSCVALADPVGGFGSDGGSLVLTNAPGPAGSTGSTTPG